MLEMHRECGGHNMSIRVLIVDDHAMMRDGLVAMLSRDPEIEIAGEAESGLEAVRLCPELEPDVVIMDVTMDDLNGIEATRQILGRQPEIRIIGLSSHKESRYLSEMLRAGALAYVLKENTYGELRTAIDRVRRGQTYLSPKVAKLGAEFMREPVAPGGSAYELLGDREREILQLLAEGLSAPQIADRLSIAASTVDTHRRNIMNKLDIHNVVELTRYAIREGLTQVDG